MAPLFALGLIAIVGAATIGVDYARGVAMQQFLSNAADAAALAAVTALPDGEDARDLALEYVEKNMPSAEYGDVLDPADVELGNWDSAARAFVPVSGPGDSATAVRVTARLASANGNALNTLFAAALGSDSMDLSAVAVAGRGGPPCVLALNPSAPSSILVSGNSTVEALGCGVHGSSTASPGLELKGKASLTSTEICVSGTASLSPQSTASPDPKEFCPGQSDPLAGLQPPSYAGCDHHEASYKNSNITLSPGVYCDGLSISANSNVTLDPGTYVIKDEAFFVGGNSTVTGSEVTIFLTGDDAQVSFKSGSVIDLTAPKSGDLEGVLFFQDPDYGGTHDWKGKSTANLRGVVYFPSGKLVSKSDTAITPEQSCTVLIASDLEFATNSGASIDTTSADCRGSLPGPYRRGIVLLQ